MRTDGLFSEKNLDFLENRWFRKNSHRMHIELYYCLSVLKKRLKMFFFRKRIGMIEKIFARFQNQKTRQMSSRRPTKSSYFPRFLKKIRVCVFFWKRRWIFSKQPNENFRKRLISQVFLSKCVSNFTTAHELSIRSNFWVFWKKRWFFSKIFCNFSKQLNKDTFLKKAFQKLFSLMQSQNVQILRFCREKDVFFLQKNPWKFSGALCLAFFIKKRVRFSNCLGNLKTIKFSGFSEK